MKTCRSFVIGYVLCGLVVVAVVVVWKESSYIAKTRLYLTVTQAVLEFLLIYLYLLRTGTLYFLLIFFLKDGVLCSPGWSQIPCSWRWPELLTLLISLLQCWVCGYELPFFTCAQVHTCSIQTFFWAFKARRFTHKLHSYKPEWTCCQCCTFMDGLFM